MNHRRPPRPWSVAIVLICLAGCTLGPDYQRPATVAGEAESFVHGAPAGGEGGETVRPLDAVDPWWQSFGDPTTADLVREALAANTDLQAAAARVVAAREGLRQAASPRWPSAEVSAGASRQKSSFVIPGAGRVNPIATTYSDSFAVAYQTDLFGGLRRGRQAARAQWLAEDAARETVVHTVISEVVRARVRLSTLDRAVEVARDVRDSWQSTFGVIDRRNRLGLVPTLEVRLARENLASAEAALVALEQQLEQARLALDVLLGRRPGAQRVASAGLDPLPDLTPIPLGLPADLLERRPDVRRAEMQLAAASAGIGVAIADLFPGLALTGSAGNSSDRLGDLLSSDSLVYNAVASLVAPIFDGGRRRAEVRAARARADAAAAEYAGAVLGALREVEDALVRGQGLRRQVELLEQRVEEARAADRSARQRYQRGVAELLGVLDTERRRRLAEEALINARAELWNARIDLHLALGGDWWGSVAAAEPKTDPSNSEEDA